MSTAQRPSIDSVKPWRSFSELPYAFGGPRLSAQLRTQPADFVVDEILAFGPDGDGEHALLRIRKTSANTEWVARRIASLAGVSVKMVGYAGLKDRHAVTTQWFSVHLGNAAEPRWRLLAEDGIEVLEQHRHRRKLKRGSLAGNQFRIRLRETSGDLDAAAEQLAKMAANGVPNYFGPQRFGRGEGNLLRAQALFAGVAPRASRHQRGLWLSAARSQLFNEFLARRVERGDWGCALDGDRLQLRGSHSHFLVDSVDERILERLDSGDLIPTGPLFGDGEPLTDGLVRELEDQVAADYADWVAGLAAVGLKQERRALRLDIEELEFDRMSPVDVNVAFTLPAGSYATSLLRELSTWTEPTSRES
ncbi:tRNA pseudouridine(13) synthase TruD [Lamprobacter modestohalophilus]|uniref:tRNA pseudouridine(13) synthase TruD n=1 Tax=Lamprobacter modestohalophilus TaxID=1064514 RepID=UPI002ADED809|nr:tRNA pseudouridine(13) synthase TruD [Lamprobacter modestohalophilus]MEA1052013.1 tRNA pseudouridine(13) synthase TruD [Lamprobacter modestohalophilus]